MFGHFKRYTVHWFGIDKMSESFYPIKILEGEKSFSLFLCPPSRKKKPFFIIRYYYTIDVCKRAMLQLYDYKIF